MLWTDFNDFERFWDPWREFESMNRAISRFASPAINEFPGINLWVSADDSVVTTEIPGVNPEDIDISVSGNSLTLRGSREADELKDGQSYHRQECWHGQFSRTIELPFTIEVNKVNAKFKKGVLSITLPKAEAEKPKKIAIKAEA